jgi:hypothetical protein
MSLLDSLVTRAGKGSTTDPAFAITAAEHDANLAAIAAGVDGRVLLPIADTQANLLSENPVAALGQHILNTTNGRFYTGDGVQPFADLAGDLTTDDAVPFAIATKQEMWAFTSGRIFDMAIFLTAIEYQAVSSASGTLTLNGDDGWNFVTTTSENVSTLTLLNIRPGQVYTLRRIGGGSGGHTIALPASGSNKVDAAIETTALATGAEQHIQIENVGTLGSPAYRFTLGGVYGA